MHPRPAAARPAAASSRHRLRRALRTVVPILHARDIRHPVVVAVPAVEAVDLEGPEAGPHVGDHHQPVVVPHIYTERALHHAGALPAVVRRAAETVLVLALASVEGAHG